VRERGTFWLRYIYLQDYTIDELYNKIKDKFGTSKGDVYGAYKLWDKDRTIIRENTMVEALKPGNALVVTIN
jgi:peptide subunit release factor 1 (eRF1)